MNKQLFTIVALCLVITNAQALEYIKQFENEYICIAYVKIMPNEETEMHYDQYPQQVKSLHGGVITRLEADGTTTKVHFPKGEWVYRPSETADKIHKSVNETSTPIELIVVQLK